MSDLAKPLYRVAQIRQAEQFAIQNLQIPSLQLMQVAGLAAFEVLQQCWPQQKQISVFCGAGNNAGDGYVLARLALQAGYLVEVFAIGPIDHLKGDALFCAQAFLHSGGLVKSWTADSLIMTGVLVDALLGTGLNRQVDQDYAGVINAINAAELPVLAIDVPSGLHADTGCVLGVAIKATVTVTFVGLKSGLFTGQAASYCGEMREADLDLPVSIFEQLPIAAHLLTKPKLAKRQRCAHKGDFGHLLLIGGNHGYSGAICLAAEAGLRSGAGLVSIATRQSHSSLLNIGRPELMCHGVEDLSQLQALLEKASVVVIGPGLGQDQWARMLFEAVLASDKPCVVDADALNLLAQQACRSDNWILTPHPGEAGRLLGCANSEIASDRFAAVSELQQRFGGVCVLKGAGTLMSDGQQVFVSPTGNPGMASGGMGDVLSGIIGALLGQGFSLIEAAKMAVYVHGEAADKAVLADGERGLLASDLLPYVRTGLN
ncbi:MAG: NAD(P)H-hydrate dehydratase [Methylomonas sp.]